MSRILTLQLDDQTFQLFNEAAKAENRPLASFIETSVLAWIREQRHARGELSPLQRAVDEGSEALRRAVG